jgi:biopolymer transport protein ExbB
MRRLLIPAVILAGLPVRVLAQQGGDSAPLPPPAVDTPSLVPLHAPVPVVEMIGAAHWVVQAVSLVLALGLFAVLTVLFFKAGELWLAGHRLRQSLASLDRAATLDEAARMLHGRRCPGAVMARAAQEEYALALPVLVQAGPTGVKERVRARVDRVVGQATARLRRGTGVLATVAATAPFIGLFGTVWGIMSSFLAISAEGTTNLAVVAPGIAEALLVTGFGLVAAIPAVIVYNAVQRRIAGLRQAMADVAVTLEVLLGRDLDRRAAERGAPA